MKDKIKKHIEKHKVIYSCVATGLTVAGITALIMRSFNAENSMGSDRLDGVSIKLLSFFSSQKENTVTVLEREGRGHPGYIVRCLETNDVFPSQTVASKVLDVSEKVISKHLNGEFPDANGLHLERIGITA